MLSSKEEWIKFAPYAGMLSMLTYIIYQSWWKKPKVNYKIEKEAAKVVSAVDIEDIGDKKAFCRCWRSSKFPACDGSHNKHNEETGDNVGPLIVKKRESAN